MSDMNKDFELIRLEIYKKDPAAMAAVDRVEAAYYRLQGEVTRWENRVKELERRAGIAREALAGNIIMEAGT